ncbi:MAG: substrate-binding domain-containing protein [Luteibacter sp.]
MAASATTPLVGGGSTFPTYAYTGQRQPAGSPVVGSPLIPSAGSLFGAYTNIFANPVTYCPTGSVAGKRIFAGNNPTVEQGSGLCFGSGPAGFASSAGPVITQAHFAASEVPLSYSDFENYKVGHGGALPEQFPAIAGAIAIVFNKSGVASLTLSEGQICAIFSGQITTWDELGAGTGPIHIVYRSDGSGTTYSLLNHLSAVCPLPTNVLSGKTAATQFKTVPLLAGTPAGGAWIYSMGYNSPVGVVGSGAVTDYVKTNDGTIGYVEVAYAVANLVKMASVRNTNSGLAVNPSVGFGTTPMPVFLSFSKVLADSPDFNGRPVIQDPSVSTQCVAMVDPAIYANPASGYPILGVSYLLGNQTANGTDATAVRNLLGSPYKNSPVRSAVTKVGRITTGYAWLSEASVLDSVNATTGIQARINSCIN